MKLILFVIATLSTFTLAAQVKPGTMVMAMVSSQINSGHKTTPTLIVANDVKDDAGNVLIAQGTPVMADFKIKNRAGCGKPGVIKITPVSTTAKNGQMVALNGNHEAYGEKKTGKSVGLTVGMLFLIPPFNFCFLAVKGTNAEVNGGTMITCTAR